MIYLTTIIVVTVLLTAVPKRWGIQPDSLRSPEKPIT